AHAVHATLQQRLDKSGRKRSRSTFDRGLGIGCNRKVIAQGSKQAQQLRGLEDGWSSSAEVDGIGRFFEHTAQVRRKPARGGDIFDQAGNIVFVRGLRK